MDITCISDTHGLHQQIPYSLIGGDILIHAGDMTANGDLSDVVSFAEWSRDLPYKHKVIIAGNHDFCFDPNGRLKKYNPLAQKTLEEAGWIYLEDSACDINGIKIYGSPWQPVFFDWAFNAKEAELAKIWEKIPKDIDILITHGPPAKILDRVHDNTHVGSKALLDIIAKTSAKVHVFGHIHEAYGQAEVEGKLFVNASTCNLAYRPVNPAVRFNFPPLSLF